MSIWNERYNTQDYIFGTEPNDFLRSVSRIIPSGKILCIGEGEGRNSVFLARNGFDVHAIDASVVGRDKALALAQTEKVNIHYTIGDIDNYNFSANKFSAVISIFCHLPSELRKRVYERIRKSLEQGSYFIIESYSKEQLNHKTGGPGSPDMLVDLDELVSEFEGFELIIAQRIKRFIFEGNGHTGLSDVVQIVAKKI